MNRKYFAAVLIAWVMAVCLAGSALASVSWYIMKDTGNEGIKYFKDEQGGYSPATGQMLRLQGRSPAS